MAAPAATVEYVPPPNGFRTFVIVWATQAFSVFGSALTFFSMTIWLTTVLYPRADQKLELAAALSAEALCFALPTVFLAPLAGAWADRHDRKRTMMVVDFMNSGLSLLLLSLIATGTLQLWMLLGIVILFAIFGAFHGSAFDTSYAMLVPKEQLPRANGMMQTVWALSGIFAPVLAASIIALPALARSGEWTFAGSAWLAGLSDGTVLAIGFDVITFLIAGIVLLFLYVPSPKRTDMVIEGTNRKKSIWADVKEGALYIWHRKPMLWLLGTFTVANFVGSPLGVFQPLLVKFNLAADWGALGMEFPQALGLLASAAGIGGLLGGLFISVWGGLKRKRVYGVLVPMIIGGVAQIIFGLSGLLYLSMAMIFIVDGMIPILNAHSQAIWQTQTPHELQGRVFSVRRVIAQFSWPLSTMLVGLAGGVFNPGTVVAVLGAILVVFCVAQLFNPYLLRVEDKEFLDELAAKAEGSGQKASPEATEPAAAEPAASSGNGTGPGEPVYRSDVSRVEDVDEPVGRR